MPTELTTYTKPDEIQVVINMVAIDSTHKHKRLSDANARYAINQVVQLGHTFRFEFSDDTTEQYSFATSQLP